MDEPKTEPTATGWLKSNAYAVVVVLLIGLIAFMVYPVGIIYLILVIIIPIAVGVTTEMVFQTEYYKSLDYQLSRLEKTAIVSAVAGSTALGLGYFSRSVAEWLESMIVF